MYSIGLDLGQRHDHSAVVMVERPEGHPLSSVRDARLLVRMAERIPLGVPYPEVVEMVRHVVEKANRLAWTGSFNRDACRLTVDATCVGRPVVDMFRAARLDCAMTAVTITSGDRQNSRRGEGSSMNVPKLDLIREVQVALESGTLRIAKGMRETGTLKRELMDVRMTAREGGYTRFGADGYGQHDDLVIALALAVWRAKRR